MSGAHFYLMLPSNASLDVYPNNKTTDYRVSLPQSIELEGNWEVGLYSVSYPITLGTTYQMMVRTLTFIGGIFMAGREGSSKVWALRKHRKFC